MLAALTLALDALSQMSSEANKKYKLGFEKRIRKLNADASKAMERIIPLSPSRA